MYVIINPLPGEAAPQPYFHETWSVLRYLPSGMGLVPWELGLRRGSSTLSMVQFVSKDLCQHLYSPTIYLQAAVKRRKRLCTVTSPRIRLTFGWNVILMLPQPFLVNSQILYYLLPLGRSTL